MKTDMFAKIVLSVIAVRCTVSLLKDLNKVVVAQKKTNRRKIDEQEQLVNVNITHVNGHPLADNFNDHAVPMEIIKNRDK